MFDFLKDLGFKAPEEEPQRGMKFSSTDDKGSIATSPDGKILSNVERDAYSTRGNRRVDNQPPQDTDRSEPELLSGIDKFRAGTSMQGRYPVDIGLQPNKNYVPMSMVYGPNSGLRSYEFKGATTPDRSGNIIDLPLYSPDNPRGYDFQNQSGSIMGTPEYDLRKQFPIEQFRSNPYIPNTAQRPPLGEPSQEVKNLADEYIVMADDSGINMNYSQAIDMARNELSGRTGMDEASFGGNMVGTASQVPQFTTQRTQVGEPNQGITSFADAKKEIQQGKEGGIKDLNFLQKGMALIRNPVGRLLGYETDDQGRLTMKGIADMEADKQKSEAFYQEGQRQRNKDRDNALRMAQMQQQAKAPVAEEEEEKKKFFQRNPMSMQEYLNKFRPVGMTGDVPLNMYGQLGGEYKYFMADGGQSNIPRGDTGEITGAGGPKDDLVGPFMLSNKEYVLPNEQIRMYGGGNYETGVKRLEQDRKNALTNFA